MPTNEVIDAQFILLQNLCVAMERRIQEVGSNSPLIPGLREAQDIVSNWKLLK